MNKVPLWFFIFSCFLIFGLGVYVGITEEEKFNCPQVEVEIWAFQQCLAFQPACQMRKGVQQFARYHEIRRWSQDNCADFNSGDDYLSQAITSEQFQWLTKY